MVFCVFSLIIGETSVVHDMATNEIRIYTDQVNYNYIL